MTALKLTPAPRVAARNCEWWKTPENAIFDVADPAARILTYGCDGDVGATREQMSLDDLREALDQAPPIVCDGPSWGYRNLMAGRDAPLPLKLRKTTYPHDPLNRYLDDPYRPGALKRMG